MTMLMEVGYPMKPEQLAAIQAAIEEDTAAEQAMTQGPWRWSVHFGSKRLDLVGRAGAYVMGFRRWGMGGAAPTFRTPDKPGDSGYMKRADAFMEIDPERPHHASWHRLLVHRDADGILRIRNRAHLYYALAVAVAAEEAAMASDPASGSPDFIALKAATRAALAALAGPGA